MDNVKFTVLLSVILQFITSVIEATGLFFEVPSKDLIIKDILTMELLVQSIEFVFYLYLVYLIFSNKLHRNITSHRYLDWFITTPVMLIGFIILFKYLRDPNRNIRLFESIQEESSNILKIIAANATMLGFGLASELSFIDTNLGVTLGFIPFTYIFNLLYSEYAKFTSLSLTFYYFIFIVWGAYGVSALLPFASKNSMYNILDLFSKNVYGLLLFTLLYFKQIRHAS
jgi:bacteriorhodopsin